MLAVVPMLLPAPAAVAIRWLQWVVWLLVRLVGWLLLPVVPTSLLSAGQVVRRQVVLRPAVRRAAVAASLRRRPAVAHLQLPRHTCLLLLLRMCLLLLRRMCLLLQHRNQFAYLLRLHSQKQKQKPRHSRAACLWHILLLLVQWLFHNLAAVYQLCNQSMRMKLCTPVENLPCNLSERRLCMPVEQSLLCKQTVSWLRIRFERWYRKPVAVKQLLRHRQTGQLVEPQQLHRAAVWMLTGLCSL